MGFTCLSDTVLSYVYLDVFLVNNADINLAINMPSCIFIENNETLKLKTAWLGCCKRERAHRAPAFFFVYPMRKYQLRCVPISACSALIITHALIDWAVKISIHINY